MDAGPNCIAVVEHFEGCRLRAYPDPKTGGVPWTIGVGATGAEISPGVVWTQQQADDRLAADLAERADDATNALLVTVSQGQFDAFVSALFNIGHGSPIKDGLIRLRSGYPSTFLRKLNAGDYSGARDQLLLWVSPGSSVEHGLMRRRKAETALWDGASGLDAIAIGDLV